jgi:hypothetical protein
VTIEGIDSAQYLMVQLRTRGADAVVQELCGNRTADLATRKKLALFITGLRGHGIEAVDIKEQPYGFVGVCRRCGMHLKVPRVPRDDGPGIEGRAVEFACPSEGGT